MTRSPSGSHATERLGRLFHSAAFLSFLTVIALVPLPFGSNRPVTWTLLEAAVGCALLLWTAAAVLTPHRAIRVPLRRYALALACFLILLCWFAVQSTSATPTLWHHPIWDMTAGALDHPVAGYVSADPQATRSHMLRFIGYGAAFFLAMQFSASQRLRHRLLLVLAVTGIGYAAYGLIVQFGGYDSVLWYPRWSYHDSLTATFVNRNSFATYAGLILLILIGLLWRAVRQVRSNAGQVFEQGDRLNELAARTWPTVVGIIIVFMALLLTQSRGGLLACLLALLVLPSYSNLRRRFSGRLMLGLFAVLTVVFLLGAGDTLRRLGAEGWHAAVSRVSIYKATMEGIAQRPWLGHGYGSFEATFPQFRSAEMLKSAVIDKAHNSYLEFAYEAGIPASVVVLAMLAALVLSCIKSAGPGSPTASASRRALAAAVLVGSHALVDFSIQIPAIAVVFATLLGTGVGASYGRAR